MTSINYKNVTYTKDSVAQLGEAETLSLYNTLAEELGHRPYSKFSNLEAGHKRVWGALVACDAAHRTKAAPNKPKGESGGKAGKKSPLQKGDGEPTLLTGDASPAEATTKEKSMSKKTATKKSAATTARRAKPEAAEAARSHNRTAGLKLRPTGKENPGREGTESFKSYALILKTPGISTEEYLKRGGARKFLTRSIRKGLVKAS